MKDKGVRIAAIISGTVILVTILAIYTIFQFIPTETISVNGQSQLEVTPDLITINFNLETIADTASEAKDSNQIKYNNLISALKALEIPEEEIKTTNINIYPYYTWNDGERKEEGYRATHTIQIELPIDESDKTSEIIDAGVNSGALINYINFELSKELREETKSKATLEATEDARVKAESIAEGLGKSLGKIVSVTDSNFNYYPGPLYARSEEMAIADAGVEAKESVQSITPGDQTVYATVNIIYKIK